MNITGNLTKKDKQAMLLLGSPFLLWVVICFFMERARQKEFRFFDSSAFRGKIVSISGSKNGEHLILDTSPHEYYVATNNKKFAGFIPFSERAQKGDSIWKASFSDTLYLKKVETGRIFTYTFLHR